MARPRTGPRLSTRRSRGRGGASTRCSSRGSTPTRRCRPVRARSQPKRSAGKNTARRAATCTVARWPAAKIIAAATSAGPDARAEHPPARRPDLVEARLQVAAVERLLGERDDEELPEHLVGRVGGPAARARTRDARLPPRAPAEEVRDGDDRRQRERPRERAARRRGPPRATSSCPGITRPPSASPACRTRSSSLRQTSAPDRGRGTTRPTSVVCQRRRERSSGDHAPTRRA